MHNCMVRLHLKHLYNITPLVAAAQTDNTNNKLHVSLLSIQYTVHVHREPP